MIILGVDPGFATIGYGIVSFKNSTFKAVEYGSIITDSKMRFENRLNQIYDELTDLIKLYKPDEMAVEEVYFAKNLKTAIQVSQARGVILIAGSKNGIKKIRGYTPLQVKIALTGYGKADKNQIQQMIKVILKLNEIPKPDDTADALAIAVCHANSKDHTSDSIS
jgi:crossover junction endodeoxyribonuclease RuvC